MSTGSTIRSRVIAERMNSKETESSITGHGDEALFREFLKGDDVAFMELFNRHTPRLYAYALKIIGNREQAHDVLQDVWERIARFRTLNKPVPRSTLGLLIRTTRNLCLNARRDRKQGQVPLHEWHQTQPQTRELTAMEEAVIEGLERLPEEYREILILHTYSGYSYEEIAEMFEENVGTIRTRAWRARTKLGRYIAALLSVENG